ncbi:C4-dicarboxylate-binding periplasmic protein, putative [Pusillimonas sp. T7-7]|uniref:TRAP transporter substrate-binding protein n=1 Tax=Pusillimonas sp. (strain T7-7) TaxID=1007105 RepID=UPI00020852F1|nr:TRAP transporter substrate-binding protein DctP [Pusillimonas sp. T7-7]AEC20727.1 C4-dicarboxylate-binding periplasmic protein, putative [Pusillimonas sp. T7-7]
MKLFNKLVMTGLAFAVSTSIAAAADYTMRISHQFPPTHHTAKRLEQMAKDVAKETDGKVEVQIFGAAQLFKPKQHHAAVASGQLEAAIILSIQWGGSLPEMAVTQIPYLMNAPAKQKAFLGSEAAKILDQKMLDKGVRNIGWIVDTNDLVFTSSTQLLDSPPKFKGVKIRGLNKLFDSGLSAMGAVAVSMPGSEVYQALQTGVIDAALTGVQAASSRKFYEVQDYGAATAIFLVFDNLVVNPEWWDGLPEDVRAGITRAVDKAVQSSLITHEGVNPDDIKKLNDAGMETVVLTPEQASALEEAMQPAVRAEFLKSTGDDGQKLIDLIKAL